MRVLHILDSPQTGGATVAAEAVACCVAGPMDHEQCAVLEGPPGALYKRYLNRFASDYVLRIGKPTPLQQAFRTVGGYASVRVIAKMRMALDEHNPDLVHLHNFKEAGTAAIIACKSRGVPVVWSCYDYWCLSPLDNKTSFSWAAYQPAKGRRYPLLAKLPLLGRRRRIMSQMNRLDAVIALSQNSKARLIEGGLTVPPIHVVPVPVFTLREQDGDDRYLPDRDPNLVLFVGGLAPHKGKHIFDAAMKIVQAQHPEVVGKSMFGAERHQVLREIARAACLVVPEQWPNPGPVVIAEAQLLGTPVVASAVGGIPEMEPASLCPAADHESFAAAILEIHQRRFTGDHPWVTEKARSRHDPATIREKLMKAYAQCL